MFCEQMTYEMIYLCFCVKWNQLTTSDEYSTFPFSFVRMVVSQTCIISHEWMCLWLFHNIFPTHQLLLGPDVSGKYTIDIDSWFCVTQKSLHLQFCTMACDLCFRRISEWKNIFSVLYGNSLRSSQLTSCQIMHFILSRVNASAHAVHISTDANLKTWQLALFAVSSKMRPTSDHNRTILPTDSDNFSCVFIQIV